MKIVNAKMIFIQTNEGFFNKLFHLINETMDRK